MNLPLPSRGTGTAIVAAAACMVALAMGLRQSLGLFVQPLTRDLGLSVADFTFALAMQNLVWGVVQPLAGALATRYGFRRIMAGGALLYTLGLVVMARAEGQWSVLLGAGLLVGLGMSAMGPTMGMSVAGRMVTPARRSLVFGLVSGAGSLGALVAAPLGQALTSASGWRAGVLGFAALAALAIPAAWIAGRVDRAPVPAILPGKGSAGAALRLALGDPSFLVMALSYFVCGMQLVFLTTHLPSYLDLCGMDPMLGASALATIGIFNVIGSLFFGWAGGHRPKLVLLGSIYLARSLALMWYFLTPPTATGTIVFAAIMGFLWLGVAPLVAGSVAERYGLRWQPMLQGVAFMSHQVGSFVGAFGGGWLFDRMGSYDLAWRIGVALGLAGGVLQIAMALARPYRPAAATG